ncbi:MAG: uracil-DNA glycosylase family protein [Bdellovibrionales bacterium]|nr:uracil-DNA glycosylase family protein [Bdellovibrionales bacterium]
MNFSPHSKIIIIGQAPGIKVHQTGVPWNDASGDRLRDWMSVSKDEFYDTDLFGIVPMAFCYPGKGKSGDLPPRPECAELWMEKIFKNLTERRLVLLIGQYSQNYFLDDPQENLTERVKNWKSYLPDYFVLPHPSPRNNIWLKKNKWFEKKTLPDLKKQIKKALELT